MKELIHIWQKWATEPETMSAALLWGHHLFFWARIGKLLEFLAGLTIIADLLGAERLRHYGEWLHGAFGSFDRPKSVKDAVLLLFRLTQGIVTYQWTQLLVAAVAWVLERPNADKWIKSFSLILLLIGFHFDLLAT